MTDGVQVDPPVATVISGAGIRAFTPGQVAFATFLGSPLAGGIAMAINKHRAGQPYALPIVAGIAMTAVLIAVGLALPGNVGNFLPIVGVFAMLSYARGEAPKLGATVPASSWGAFGLGIAGLALAGAAIVGVVLMQEAPSVSFGHDQEVRYAGGATEAEAKALGDELVATGWFSGHAATVQIEHGAKGKLEVSFVLQDGAWDRKDIYDAFVMMKGVLEDKLATPIALRLCDDELEMHRVIE